MPIGAGWIPAARTRWLKLLTQGSYLGKLANDALLATSTGRLGIRVLTAHARDFPRLAELRPCEREVAVRFDRPLTKTVGESLLSHRCRRPELCLIERDVAVDVRRDLGALGNDDVFAVNQ